MAQFQRLLASILVAIVASSLVGAVPTPEADANDRLSTRKLVTVGRRGLKIESFHPASTFETFGEGLELPNSLLRKPGPDEEAKDYVAQKLNIDPSTIGFRSGFSLGRTRHAWLRQSYKGIPFANAVANVAFKDNKVVSFGSSFVKPKRVASSKPTINLKEFLPAVEESLDGKYNNHPTRLEYLARPDGSASLVYTAQIENVETNKWYEAFIDAHSGELLSVVDFTADATYHALPITKQILPDGQETLVDPEDLTASPGGWHESGATTLTTQGNNVVAFKTSQTTGFTTESSPSTFNYPYSDLVAPTVQSNVDAARTNAFYVVNTIHDFAYRYGFTESAFNFQNDNFGKGGAGDDRITVSVQDSTGINNAYFATPPDGQSGRTTVYIWTRTDPNRDGSLENDILVHEVTHGITNRLTGGGTASCLQTTEASALGEGWSDALADWTHHKSEDIQDFIIAQYVTNKPAGIRTWPYSVSSTTNPLTYSSVNGLTAIHKIGEIWANLLHNVYADLVAQHGFSLTAKTNPDGLEGNIVWLHLFIDALALQPCNPGFVSARAAWIQADANRYGGANRCLLWKAFAKRGLGTNATGDFVDNFDIPADC